jgi:hypothetical protein
MMQKYQTVPKNAYCTFCKSVGHDDKLQNNGSDEGKDIRHI